MFATSVFYAVVGVIFLAVMFMADFPPHIGIIGIFSLVAAYGLYRKRAWAIWFVLILFFTGTAFSAFMIYDVLARDYILGVSAIVYLILTWVFTTYAATRRNTLEG
jgi:uncharacterized membrane protein (DUF2068 family)